MNSEGILNKSTETIGNLINKGIDVETEAITKYTNAVSSITDKITNSSTLVTDKINEAIGGGLEKAGVFFNGVSFGDGNMSNQTWEGLTNQTINSGLNFIRGEVTSAFAPLDNVIQDSAEALNTISKTAIETTSILPQIIQTSSQYTLQEVSEYTLERVGEILNPTSISEQLGYYTAYYTKQCTKSAQDILKEIVKKKDDTIKAMLEDNETKAKAEKTKKTEEKINKIKEKSKEVAEKTEDGVKMVTSYIKNGPEWVKKYINSYIDFAVNEAEKYIDIGTDTVIDYRNKYLIQIPGEWIGKRIANDTNRILEKTTQAQLSTAKLKVAAVSMKASNAIMTATQIVVAQVGPMLGKAIKLGVKKGMEAIIKAIGI